MLHDHLIIVNVNQLPNVPVTRDDIMAYEYIFGPNVGSLKRNTTRKTSPASVVTRVTIPPDINETHMEITLSIYIMFVNKVAFTVTI